LGGVVALAPVTDLFAADREGLGHSAVRGLLSGDVRPDRLRAASPSTRQPPRCPVTVLHGDSDQAVPVAQSTTYADLLRGHGCRVRSQVIPQARHMHLVNPERP